MIFSPALHIYTERKKSLTAINNSLDSSEPLMVIISRCQDSTLNFSQVLLIFYRDIKLEFPS